MSRITIGKHWPKSAQRGDFTAECAICGMAWPRSKLRKDGAGRLVCPDEGAGLDEVTLNRDNATAGSKPNPQYRPIDSRTPRSM